MKIYFEDGQLLPKDMLPFKCAHTIDAGEGYSYCDGALEWIRYNDPRSVVYTNTIIALHNIYAWNDDCGIFEVYMRCGKNRAFHRIDELTQRELRYAHNIMKMYMNGEFRKLQE
jgi:hypothetical protein